MVDVVSRVPSAAAAHIGARITERRLQRGLTQDEVAVRASIDSSNVRAYESGRAMPSIHSLVRIATALEVAPGDLLEGISLDQFPVSSAVPRHRVT
ncbi:helix-turn-helix domain-containing protein [Propionicimonas sp.]|uniref:helix-turn-helix domain-containing protein n=1 Tax=Propionicimonas sp. TaxID=1955623 RepID=UPI003A523113